MARNLAQISDLKKLKTGLEMMAAQCSKGRVPGWSNRRRAGAKWTSGPEAARVLD
jgi:hypothetical protein